MLEERTIWERLRLIPDFKRSEIRKEMAYKMGIEPHSVLKHFQKNGWHNRLKTAYKRALVEVTATTEEEWENPNAYLVIDNLTMKYRLRTLSDEDFESELVKEGGACE